MKKFIITFVVAFPAIMVVNQMFYGFTFEGYALAAAFPKVLILSLLAASVVAWWSKADAPGDTRQADRPNPSPTRQKMDELERLKSLLDAGTIDQDEYKRLKNEILQR